MRKRDEWLKWIPIPADSKSTLNVETSSNPVEESTNSLMDENASDGSRMLASGDNIKSSHLQGCSLEQFSKRDSLEVANLDIVEGDSLIVQLDDGVKSSVINLVVQVGGQINDYLLVLC